MSFLPPNYIFFPPPPNTAIIDVGCGEKAEFGRYFAQAGARVFALDPTHKHRRQLEEFASQYPGRFNYFQFALAAEAGTFEFHESEVHESGSLLVEHINVRRDVVTKYPVEAIDPQGLLSLVDGKVGLLKIDIEGAEFELFDHLGPADFADVDQLFVEFHAEQIAGKTPTDVRRIVRAFERHRFRAYTIDRVNYLFVAEQPKQTKR